MGATFPTGWSWASAMNALKSAILLKWREGRHSRFEHPHFNFALSYNQPSARRANCFDRMPVLAMKNPRQGTPFAAVRPICGVSRLIGGLAVACVAAIVVRRPRHWNSSISNSLVTVPSQALMPDMR
jgi:hypothetical protein